jgi:Lon protease-like protein
VSDAVETPLAPPEILPLFPLAGALLLPGNWLPLNVFEPRYRALVTDVMESHRHLGIIQPLPTPDWPALEIPEQPELYPVGATGYIDRCEPQSDGRFLILLRGLTRFRIRHELELLNGYRRVTADYEEFAEDLREHRVILDPRPVLAALDAYSNAHQLSFDLDMLTGLPGSLLVNGLAGALPFSAQQKQALLEAPDLLARQDLLFDLMGSTGSPGPPIETAPITVN